MNVHTARVHGENPECGLCDFEAKHSKTWIFISQLVNILNVMCAKKKYGSLAKSKNTLYQNIKMLMGLEKVSEI